MSALSRPGLTVDYRPEGSDGLGEVYVTVQAGAFAGAATSYIGDDDLLAWADALRRFPWPDGSTADISAGLGDQDTLRLKALSLTRRGQLAVAVYLADIDTDAHSPTVDSKSEVAMLVKTGHEAARRFADELSQAVGTGHGSAHLAWEELA